MDFEQPPTGQPAADSAADRAFADAGIPVRREVLMCDESLASGTDLVDALETGRLLVSRERYGIVCGWKKSEGQFRGVLLQQRSVKEDRTFDTAKDLREWYLSTVFAIE